MTSHPKNHLMNPFASRRTLIRPRLLAPLAATLLLLGCASPGPEHPALPATNAAALGLAPAASTPVSAQWWRSLNDPVLDQLVERALQGHPSLSLASTRVERAMKLADLSRSADSPQVGLGLELNRQRYTQNGLYPPPIAGNTYNSGTLQTGLSWSPDFFGVHASELASAIGQTRALEADRGAAATTLAAQVTRGYVALARLLAQRDISQRALAQRQQILDLVHQRMAAGLDSQIERTPAAGALPDTRQQIEALNEQITLARHQLAVLSAQAPEALNTLSPQLGQLALEQAPPVIGADLLGRRPDVVAARWRVEASAQDVQVARGQFYPNINLTAFVGLNSIGLDKLIEGSSRQIGVTPALRLPLFDGGRLRAQLGGRQAELDAAIAQYNGTVLEAAREASDALASAQSLSRQQRELELTQASAESAHALARQRHDAGLGNYLQVLNAETQLLAQRRLAADLRARQLDTRIALMKALGGGWSDPLPALAATGR